MGKFVSEIVHRDLSYSRTFFPSFFLFFLSFLLACLFPCLFTYLLARLFACLLSFFLSSSRYFLAHILKQFYIFFFFLLISDSSVIQFMNFSSVIFFFDFAVTLVSLSLHFSFPSFCPYKFLFWVPNFKMAS